MGWALTFFVLTTVALWYLGRYSLDLGRGGNWLKLERQWQPFRQDK